jgi:hypothetical protein
MNRKGEKFTPFKKDCRRCFLAKDCGLPTEEVFHVFSVLEMDLESRDLYVPHYPR